MFLIVFIGQLSGRKLLIMLSFPSTLPFMYIVRFRFPLGFLLTKQSKNSNSLCSSSFSNVNLMFAENVFISSKKFLRGILNDDKCVIYV